mmetsp:Transcript_27760/g.50722  ORF Transcript_27760/g.50722 Transcript_27760/m.50722 type:complete len:199 (+) Transcript_27760:184-780(+)
MRAVAFLPQICVALLLQLTQSLGVASLPADVTAPNDLVGFAAALRGMASGHAEPDSVMDRINRMGRDMCKDRPDHPRCKVFKEKPADEPAAEPPAQADPEPVVEPVTEPAPVEEQTTVSTTVSSSMQEIQDGNVSSSLDSWGKPKAKPVSAAPAPAPEPVAETAAGPRPGCGDGSWGSGKVLCPWGKSVVNQDFNPSA